MTCFKKKRGMIEKYELRQAAGNSYYIESPARIGLVKLNETEVCLIDSGSDMMSLPISVRWKW